MYCSHLNQSGTNIVIWGLYLGGFVTRYDLVALPAQVFAQLDFVGWPKLV